MKLTTVTHVSVDGVMQGLGGPDEDRRGGFERGGWALPLFVNDNEGATFVNQVYQRAGAFLFGRRTYEIFARPRPLSVARRRVVEVELARHGTVTPANSVMEV